MGNKDQYSLSLYEKAMPDDMSLDEKFENARRCGFDSVEICIDAHEERQKRLLWDRSRTGALLEHLTRNDIRVYTVSLSLLRSCPLGILDESENAGSLDILRRGVEFTAAVGARVMLINGYDVFDEPSTPLTARRFEKNLKIAAQIAAANGVIIGIENAESPFIDTVEKAAYRAGRAGSPNICVYADIGNAYIAAGGETAQVLNDLEHGRGKIAAAHLKDSLPGRYRDVNYGQGDVDFNASIPKLMGLGVRIFTAELFMKQGGDWESEAVFVNRFLRGFIDNY